MDDVNSAFFIWRTFRAQFLSQRPPTPHRDAQRRPWAQLSETVFANRSYRYLCAPISHRPKFLTARVRQCSNGGHQKVATNRNDSRRAHWSPRWQLRMERIEGAHRALRATTRQSFFALILFSSSCATDPLLSADTPAKFCRRFRQVNGADWCRADANRCLCYCAQAPAIPYFDPALARPAALEPFARCSRSH